MKKVNYREELWMHYNILNTIKESYEESIIDVSEPKELLLSLVQFGDNINFDTDIWDCNKLKKSEVHKNDVQIYFNPIPDKYRELAKYYAITMLIRGNSPAGTNNDIKYISKFLIFLEYNSIDLIKINSLVEHEFFRYLNAEEKYGGRYKSSIWGANRKFLQFVRTWYGVSINQGLFKKKSI